MSLHLEFEPHSWYKGFAIKPRQRFCLNKKVWYQWEAVGLNGNTGYIVHLHASTLASIKNSITAYNNGVAERDAYNRKMIGEK